MADVTAQQIADFLGQGTNAELVALSGQALPVITSMVRAYTRDVGFDPVTGEPAPGLEAVIITATARLVANPEQLRHTVGGVQMLDGFQGFNLAETYVLNRFHRKAH